jgi:outer membrane lipoprotein-sorting protein
MKPFFLCIFLLILATAATTARAQTGAAGKTYGGDRSAVEGSNTDEAPTKITGVLDKIERYRNGLRITIKSNNKKVYQYSVYYEGQGPQTTLSVDKNVKVALKTLDDLKVEDIVSIKLDGGNVKSLVLKERPAEKAKDKE